MSSNTLFKRKKTIIAVVVILVIAGVYAKKATTPDQTYYLTDSIKRTTITQSIETTGSLQPINTVVVTGQASGQIQKVNVAIGDEVKAGANLIEIDPLTATNTLKEAIYSINNYSQQVKTNQQLLSNLEQKLAQQQSVLKIGGTDNATVTDLKNNVASTKAALQTAISLLNQAYLSKTKASDQLKYVHVTSPITGVVSAVAVSEGQSINAVQSAPSLVTIADNSKMKLKLELSESDIPKLKTGLNVSFKTLGSSESFIGTLSKIDPAPLAVSDNTTSTTTSAVYYYGTVLVDDPKPYFKTSMSVEASIILNKKENILAVSSTAIKTKNAKTFVMIKRNEGKVDEVEVKTGLSDGVNTEILSTDIKEGDIVVLASQSETDKQKLLQESASKRQGPPMR